MNMNSYPKFVLLLPKHKRVNDYQLLFHMCYNQFAHCCAIFLWCLGVSHLVGQLIKLPVLGCSALIHFGKTLTENVLKTSLLRAQILPFSCSHLNFNIIIISGFYRILTYLILNITWILNNGGKIYQSSIDAGQTLPGQLPQNTWAEFQIQWFWRQNPRFEQHIVVHICLPVSVVVQRRKPCFVIFALES